MVAFFTILFLSISFGVAWSGSPDHVTPQGWPIRWLGALSQQDSDEVSNEVIHAWQTATRSLANQPNPGRENQGYWVACDFAVGDSLRIHSAKGAKARVLVGSKSIETSEMLIPFGFNREIQMYDSNRDRFLLSYLSVGLRDKKWLRFYLVFPRYVAEIDMVFFEGITFERIPD